MPETTQPPPTKKQQLVEFVRCAVDAAQTGNKNLLAMVAANLNPLLASLPEDWPEQPPAAETAPAAPSATKLKKR